MARQPAAGGGKQLMSAADRPTVLVVEDDAGLARLQQLRLERAGYAVTSASDAAEGLRRALAGGIDLIVLDHRLPGGASGLELYQKIKAAGRDVPTILVTAFSDEKVVLQALRAGFTDFVPKTPNYLDYLVPAIERVLREKRIERQLAGIIDSAMDAVLTIDGERRVTLFNPAAERAFRCGAAEAIGSPISRFLPNWEDILRDSPPGHSEIEGLQLRHTETDGLRADGERFSMEVSLSRARHLAFWTCVARDITDRRRAEEEHLRLIQERAARAEAERAEERLRQFIAKLQEQAHLLELAHVLVRDNEERIIFWNKGTSQMYGWTEDEALGENAHVLLRTTFSVPLEQIRAELHVRGQWEGELIHTRKDGSTLVVASHWALHRDAQGRPVAVLEVNNDVTELKRLQEALRQSVRRMDEFLAVLAHELRNPLAPILNALHVLRLARNNPESAEESHTVIERQVRNMVLLIDDLLDLSRITRGKIQLRKEPVALADVVQSAVESSRPAIDAAGHQLTVSLPAEPIVLDADATRLSQVLLNLLNNAAKYTEPGGRIWVEAGPERDELVIAVRDTGVGIPAEVLPNIFEMFAQADRSLERSQGGLGIGLSLVRGLVRLHGGTVAARSAGPGKGSEFSIRLPLRRTAPAPPAEAPARPARADAPRTKGPARRVLVVDDNVDGALSLEKLLNLLGHSVAVTHDGYAALEAAERFRPEVVLLDIGMPGMDGYEVARRLRKLPGMRSVLLVAMTGWGKDSDRRKAMEAGFNAHLVKPVELQDVEVLLANAVVCSGDEEAPVRGRQVEVKRGQVGDQ
jgi:PAS domain S-box-containing protein